MKKSLLICLLLLLTLFITPEVSAYSKGSSGSINNDTTQSFSSPQDFLTYVINNGDTSVYTINEILNSNFIAYYDTSFNRYQISFDILPNDFTFSSNKFTFNNSANSNKFPKIYYSASGLYWNSTGVLQIKTSDLTNCIANFDLTYNNTQYITNNYSSSTPEPEPEPEPEPVVPENADTQELTNYVYLILHAQLIMLIFNITSFVYVAFYTISNSGRRAK